MSSNLRAILQARVIAPIVAKMMEGIEVKRGDVIEHATIERVSGEKRDAPRSRYRSAVSRWKKRVLTERGIFLVAVARVGYRAMAAPEQLRVPVNAMKRANRAVAHGLLACEVVPDEELDADDRAKKAMVLSRGVASLTASRDATAGMAARLLAAPSGPPKMTA